MPHSPQTTGRRRPSARRPRRGRSPIFSRWSESSGGGSRHLQHARWATSDRSWFPALSDRDESVLKEENQSAEAKALAEHLESLDEKITLLSEGLRADMDLLMLQASATQQEQTERLQGYLSRVTGLILVPTFVAGLFGANTRLPGGGSWMGFDLMVVLMVVSSIGVYWIMRRLAR